MTRHREARRRRIIDVDTIASLNQAADLRKTPGIIVFGPLSSVAAHGERFCRKPFRKFWPNQRRWGPSQRQTAHPNAPKIRTRRRRASRRVWCGFRDFTSPRPPGTRRRSRKRPFSDIVAHNGLVRTPKFAKIARDAARRPTTPCVSFRNIWRGAWGRSGAVHTLWWRNRKKRQGD